MGDSRLFIRLRLSRGRINMSQNYIILLLFELECKSKFFTISFLHKPGEFQLSPTIVLEMTRKKQ